jgi:membrane protein required for colicin V production
LSKMDKLNLLDFLIIAAVLIGFISGFKRGLIMELSSIAGIFLGLWLAIKCSDWVANWLETTQDFHGKWVIYISFLFVFLATYVCAFFIGKMLSITINLMMLGVFNKIAGGLFGSAKILLLSSIGFLFLRAVGLPAISSAAENSAFLYKPITQVASSFYPKLNDALPAKPSKNWEGN